MPPSASWSPDFQINTDLGQGLGVSDDASDLGRRLIVQLLPKQAPNPVDSSA
jgi:hypothetical protein